MRELGRHFVFELFGCDPRSLDDLKGIEDAMKRGAEDAGVKVLGEVFHRFSPQGVTGVVIIAESHIAIHTWPEMGYAAVDIFTCSTNTDPMKAFQRLRDLLRPRSMTLMELKRGIFMGDNA